ncbi:MAG: hypothetical protein R3B91_15250 [Planctomycetaceae bacterium]
MTERSVRERLAKATGIEVGDAKKTLRVYPIGKLFDHFVSKERRRVRYHCRLGSRRYRRP